MRRSAGLANRLESSFFATVSPPSALPSSAAILMSGSTAFPTGTGSAPRAQRRPALQAARRAHGADTEEGLRRAYRRIGVGERQRRQRSRVSLAGSGNFRR